MVKRICGWEYPSEWSEWCAQLAAVLDARHRWRLPVLLAGMLFACGRRTVTTWLRAAGVSDDYADYYYFLASVGRKSESLATQLAALVLRTLPSARAVVGRDRRLAHQAIRSQGRGRRHPSQSNARTGRPEVLVWPHLGHALALGASSLVGRRWPCRCGRCCMSASRRSPRSPSTAAGSFAPSSSWRRGWWSGSL